MEELQLQDIEQLLDELEEEHGAEESLPSDIEELLHALQSSNLYLARLDAAERLGKVDTSDSGIVQALIAALESDSIPEVRRAATKSLRAAVHQEYLQRDLGLAIHAKVAEVMSFLPPGNRRYWLLACLYAPILIGVTYLLFAVEGTWRLWAAGIVWFVGGGFGMYILIQKGYGAVLEKLLAKLERWDELALVVLAAVGPAVLLAALLAEPRHSTPRTLKRCAEDKDTGRLISGEGSRSGHAE